VNEEQAKALIVNVVSDFLSGKSCPTSCQQIMLANINAAFDLWKPAPAPKPEPEKATL
jgi:hypothetical protein